MWSSLVFLLAEISDKMPTVVGCTATGCIVAIIALGLGIWRRPLVLTLLPVIGLGDYLLWASLAEDGFLQAMVRETSWQYVIGWFIGWNAPFVLAVGIAMVFPRRCRSPGHCASCGYNLTGNVSGRCPECGTPTCSGERA